MRRCTRCGATAVDEDWACAACHWQPALEPIPCFAPQLDDGSAGFAVEAFDALAELEPQSFWFRARNRLIAMLIERHYPGARRLLEVGCGTGFVLSGLAESMPHVALTGIDASMAGLAIARRRLPDVPLFQMDATNIAWRDEFDVVGCFDVLEHIDDDGSAIDELARAARPGGGVLITVPQHAWLWSADDDYGHHRRRYGRRGLLAKLSAAGLRPVQTTSFVSLLLPAMAVSRWRRRRASTAFDPQAELRQAGALGAVLERVLDAERALVSLRFPLPVGGSLVVAARRS